MPKHKTDLPDFRLPSGEVIELALSDFYAMYDPSKLSPPTIKRQRATFLPGVNPEWEKRKEQRYTAWRQTREANGWRRRMVDGVIHESYVGVPGQDDFT